MTDILEEITAYKLKEIAVDDGHWQPTLILVGTRLGIDKITPVYWEALKAALQMKQSIGIAGWATMLHHLLRLKLT